MLKTIHPQRHTRAELFSGFVNAEDGQDLVEYALIAACMALGSVASLKSLATSVTAAFTNVNTNLTSAL